MAEYLSAIFRSYRDASDARQSLAESGLCELDMFLFSLAASPGSPKSVFPMHEMDHAEYAAHGEWGLIALNRFIEPQADCFVASISEDSRAAHALLVAADPPPALLVQICARLKDCGAFALRPPGSRWRLCNSH
ncbi:hypothetical protein QF000_001470 [Paraburkholderia atlantica]|uniref:Uncharacterized protein n=1 Tax=Paraburkholderia atlantica TaxID=2654982 RepID=A0A6I1PYG4_PARAM|nr:hypothetical protein [Paraburkholderia atlantica]MBB5414305.1 hypothetical protein [Paraburkholderia atlantica]MBB5426932.1 hypothetical protein [Paraburkholderia atlantica]MPW10207.1 hypothetical protein [Paraburkholderia atlantica]NUY34981.1 hypothetical protein [Paraburkholderia atlantica]